VEKMSISASPVSGPTFFSFNVNNGLFSFNLPISPTNGNTLFLTFYGVGDVRDPSIISVSQGGVTWATALANDNGGDGEIWYGVVGPNASNNITINVNGSTNLETLEIIIIAEWGGVFALDQTGSNFGSDVSAGTTGSAGPTNNNNELLIALIGTFAGATPTIQSTPLNGFNQFDGTTSVQQGIDNNFSTLALLYLNVSIIMSYSSGTSFNQTAEYQGGIASFIQTKPPISNYFIGDGLTFYSA
jgi:hypothetical protein